MNRNVSASLREAYANSRKKIHALVTGMPWLDRTVGAPLRSFAGRWEWKIAYRALPNPLPIDGCLFFHRPEDAYIVSRLSLKAYEGEVRKQISELLKPGMTLVDVGANLGWYVLLGARLVGPSGRVYAFEAASSTATVLAKNIAANHHRNVTIVTKAVTDRSGRISFFIEDSSGGSGVFASGRETDRTEVEAVSLDEFFQEQGWPEVHVIKIDVEGAEKLVLSGMRELSRRNPALKLIVEINFRRFSLEELFDALQLCGFSRFRALELGRNLVVPRDYQVILDAARRITVNLLCEKM